MDDRFNSENTSFITVTAEDIDISSYKIYLNGYIHGTATIDKKPQNGHFIRKEPGKYRIIVREENASKENRAESNEINFEIKEKEHMHFSVTTKDNKLLLITLSANK